MNLKELVLRWLQTDDPDVLRDRMFSIQKFEVAASRPMS